MVKIDILNKTIEIVGQVDPVSLIEFLINNGLATDEYVFISSDYDSSDEYVWVTDSTFSLN